MSRKHAKLLCFDVTNLNGVTINTIFFARSLQCFCPIFVLSLCPYNSLKYVTNMNSSIFQKISKQGNNLFCTTPIHSYSTITILPNPKPFE